MKFCVAFCSVLLVLVVAGCKTDVDSSNSATGSVSGYIDLYSSDGNPISSASGVTVTISGSDKTSVSDDAGKWTIDGLSAGIYTFTFSKQGYGTSKVIGYQFVGGGTAYITNVVMSAPSEEKVNFQAFLIYSSNGDTTRTYNLTAALPPPYTESRSFLLCMGPDSAALDKSPESAPFMANFVNAGSGYDGSFNWSGTDLIEVGSNTIPKGTKLYATLAIAGEGKYLSEISTYFDPVANRQMYTALGKHSQILSFVMP